MKLARIIGLLLAAILISCGGNESAKVPDNKSQIDSNTERITALENRVTDLEQSISVIESNLTSLQSQVSINVADIASLESQLQDEIDERKAQDQILKQKIRVANQKRKALARRFSRFKSSQNRINQRLQEGLSTLEDYTISSIEDLNQAVNSLRAVNNLQFYIMAAGFRYLDNKINSVESSISNRISNLSISDINGLNSSLQAIQDSIENLEISDIAGLQSALDSLGSQIADLSSEVDSLDVSDIEGLQGELNDLEEAISDVSEASGSGDCQIDLRDINQTQSQTRADIYINCGSYGSYRLSNNKRLY